MSDDLLDPVPEPVQLAEHAEHAHGIDRDTFRHAFRHVAATVAVVTVAGRDGRARGMTATSMCPLSLDPPTVLVCVDRAARTHPELTAARRFGVDILGADQHAIAAYCARHGREKLLADRWLIEPHRADEPPHLRGAIVRLECTIDTIHAASTHDIIVGRVRAAQIAEGAPLLYHDGAFDRPAGRRLPLDLAGDLELDPDPEPG